MMEFRLIRQPSVSSSNGKEGFTQGEFLVEGVRLAYTVEDQDRALENGGEKVYGKTCIPRGRYRILVDFSNRFQKRLPRIINVPGFSGIRVHGGNRAEDSLGCILIGYAKTPDGVANCAPAVQRLIDLIDTSETMGRECWISIV